MNLEAEIKRRVLKWVQELVDPKATFVSDIEEYPWSVDGQACACNNDEIHVEITYEIPMDTTQTFYGHIKSHKYPGNLFSLVKYLDRNYQ